MNIDWNDEKNEWLEKHRGLSFEVVADKIIHNDLVDNIKHPNKEKYPHQFVYVIKFNEYCYIVPYVKSDGGVFLKTIVPSRKMTKYYLGGKDEGDR